MDQNERLTGYRWLPMVTNGYHRVTNGYRNRTESGGLGIERFCTGYRDEWTAMGLGYGRCHFFYDVLGGRERARQSEGHFIPLYNRESRNEIPPFGGEIFCGVYVSN